VVVVWSSAIAVLSHGGRVPTVTAAHPGGRGRSALEESELAAMGATDVETGRLVDIAVHAAISTGAFTSGWLARQ